MQLHHKYNAKAPLLNWDIFCGKYNALMEEAVKYQQSVLAIKNIARHNKWNKQQTVEAIENVNQFVIIITDNLQQIAFTCHGFEQMTGYTLAEAKGRNPKFLQGPGTNVNDTYGIKEKLSRNETSETILQNYRKDGASYLCKITIKPIININKKLVNYIAYEEEMAA